MSEITHKDYSLVGKFGFDIMSFKGFVWGGIIKKTLFDTIRFPEGCWYEDIMIRFTLMRMAHGFEFVNQSMYYYNIHNDNASKKIWKKSDIKSLDFFVVIEYLIKFNHLYSLDNDEIFYSQLLYELSTNLWFRSKGLNRGIRKSIFYKAKEYFDMYKNNKYHVIYGDLPYVERAFLTNNFFLWEMASFHSILLTYKDNHYGK